MSLSLSLNFLDQSYRSEWNGRRSRAKFLPTPQQVLRPLPPSLLTLPSSPPKFGTSSRRRWRSLMRSKRPMKMISQNLKVKPLTQVLTPLHLSKKMVASGGLMAWAVVHTGCETTGMVVCGTLIAGKGCTMSPIGELYLFGYRLRFVLFHSVRFGSSFLPLCSVLLEPLDNIKGFNITLLDSLLLCRALLAVHNVSMRIAGRYEPSNVDVHCLTRLSNYDTCSFHHCSSFMAFLLPSSIDYRAQSYCASPFYPVLFSFGVD